MAATLKSVQWPKIEQVAVMWQPHLDLPIELIVDELQLGWFKWERFKKGQNGFVCGVPLAERPPESQLPSPHQRIGREFLEQFAIKRGWPIPADWFPRPAAGDSFPGRPSIMRAIVQELKRSAEEDRLETTLIGQARALLQWADKNFLPDQIPTVKTIENRIRSDYRVLKTKLT